MRHLVFRRLFLEQPERMAGDLSFLRDQQQVISSGGRDPNFQVAECEAVRHERVIVLDGRVGAHGPENIALRIFEAQLEPVLAVELGQVCVNRKFDRPRKLSQPECTSWREEEVFAGMVVLEYLATDHKRLNVGLRG